MELPPVVKAREIKEKEDIRVRGEEGRSIGKTGKWRKGEHNRNRWDECPVD